MMFKKTHFVFVTFIAVFAVVSCKPVYTPKPQGYFRIDYPEHAYQTYDSSCTFTFEYPLYATLEDDKDRNAEPCWFNIVYEPFDARLHLSYKAVIDIEHFYSLEQRFKRTGL